MSKTGLNRQVQLILPTQAIVQRYDNNLECSEDLLLLAGIPKREPLICMTQSLEYEDDTVSPIDYVDKLYHRIFDVTDSRETANVVAQSTWEFGRRYEKILKRLGLYEDYDERRDKNHAPYYFVGELHGDIFLRSSKTSKYDKGYRRI